MAQKIPNTGIENSGGSAPAYTNQEMFSLATTGDYQSTGATLSFVPIGAIRVLVNGKQRVIGDAVKTKDGYFSRDGGTTAVALDSLQVGDIYYHNASTTGLNLKTSSTITFNENL